ncbi:hypothetical protein [Gimesia panareensis]|uniref:Uncharacterized protein n=1 Tax=Gimesia panareensis TaxID=2527978 RepID=A0A517Q591_9PLAN|nr:hypothetical protein [Gimesia panareensis]QDT26777.1 hypothetical protein Enr10x_20870 [Gimesia panareensis]QDU50329.1 hypothetical protein Pan110_26750 [Gimesia panareensis]
MKPFLLFVLTGIVWCVACANASAEEEFLLQVDVLEQDTAAEAESEMRRVRGIEVVAVPDRPFFFKSRLGGHIQLVSGELTPDENGYQLRFEYQHTLYEGQDLPGGQPVVHVGRINTRVSIQVGQEVVLGGLVSGRRKETYRLKLSRDEPLKNEVFQMLDPHRPILPLLKEVEDQN